MLVGSAAMTLLAPADATALTAEDAAQRDLERYAGFGCKTSGGPGDVGVGEWLHTELERSGFSVGRHWIDVPWFASSRAELVCEAATAALIPQAIVVPTGPKGLSGPLAHMHAGELPSGLVERAIVLITLPYARWSSALSPTVRESVAAVVERGAAAAVLIPSGPTDEAIALNADGLHPMFDLPVAVLAPRAAAPFVTLAARRERATLYLAGAGGRRKAFNLIGRVDRGRGRWIIVSTPRSGWFDCVGERGPGVAVWLALARWASVALLDHDIAFVSASGHEYEYLGAKRMLSEGTVPAPHETDLWLHLGANVAARDWHEAGSLGLLPLPSADPQRFLVASERVIGTARKAFAGLPGLESPYPEQGNAGGELGDIAAAGYPNVAGIFGAHRFHHAAQDDLRCVRGELVDSVTDGCKHFLSASLNRAPI